MTDLTPQTLQQLVRDRCNLRIEPAMADYLLTQLRTGHALPDSIPVIGHHARTGQAMRYAVPADLVANREDRMHDEQAESQ